LPTPVFFQITQKGLVLSVQASLIEKYLGVDIVFFVCILQGNSLFSSTISILLASASLLTDLLDLHPEYPISFSLLTISSSNLLPLRRFLLPILLLF